MHICIHTHIHTGIRVSYYTCMYIHTYTQVYAYLTWSHWKGTQNYDIHAYTHTYIHTQRYAYLTWSHWKGIQNYAVIFLQRHRESWLGALGRPIPMYACIYVCMHACEALRIMQLYSCNVIVCICMHAMMRVIYAYMYIHTHTHTNIWKYVCMYALYLRAAMHYGLIVTLGKDLLPVPCVSHMYVCMYVYIHTYTYIYRYIHTYIYIYIYIYTHTVPAGSTAL